LVYLAAFLFEPDENPIEVLASWGDNPLLKAMRFEDDGRTSIDPSGAGQVFYGCCEPGDASAAIKRLRPFGAAANELAGAAWK
jgi:hypothetical protein